MKSIRYDGVTKEWIVEVNGVEVFRSAEFDIAFSEMARYEATRGDEKRED